MKKIIPISILITFLTVGCIFNKNKKQNSKASDSLSFYLTEAKNKKSHPETRFIANQKALAIILAQDQDSLFIQNLFTVANQYHNIKAIDDYKKICSLIEHHTYKTNDSIHLAKVYTYLGDYYTTKSYSDSAYLYYLKAERLYSELNDKFNIGNVNLKKGFLQYDIGDYQNCELSGFKALESFQNIKDKDMLYETYNLLGMVYNELQEFQKALEYHEKALDLVKKNTSDYELLFKITSLNNIGVVYRNMNKNKEALLYFKIALREKNLHKNNPYAYATLSDNVAYSLFKLQEYDALPDLFYKALKIRDSLQIIPGIIINKLHLSEYYQYKKDTIKATVLAKEAYTLSKKQEVDPRNILQSLKQLISLSPIEKEIYFKEYIKISDSLQLAQHKIHNRMARLSYETEELTAQKEHLKTQNKNIIIWSVILLFITILLFMIRHQRSKNKELKLREIQQQINEEIYNLLLSQQDQIKEVKQAEKKRIGQELHDGILGRLFGIRLHLDNLNKKEDPKTREDRAYYINELQNLEKDIREISHNLNDDNTNLVSNNFIGIVTDLINEQQKLTNTIITTSIETSIQWDRVSNLIKINLYRIIQESFHNINKHAQAQHINIDMSTHIRKNIICIKLVIEDDGIGFNTHKKTKGIGLQNIESRAKSLKGNFSIISKKGKGTKIKTVIPIQ